MCVAMLCCSVCLLLRKLAGSYDAVAADIEVTDSHWEKWWTVDRMGFEGTYINPQLEHAVTDITWSRITKPSRSLLPLLPLLSLCVCVMYVYLYVLCVGGMSVCWYNVLQISLLVTREAFQVSPSSDFSLQLSPPFCCVEGELYARWCSLNPRPRATYVLPSSLLFFCLCASHVAVAEDQLNQLRSSSLLFLFFLSALWNSDH